MKQMFTNEATDRLRAWASGYALFYVGQWVTYNGQEYQVLDVNEVSGRHWYTLNDGSPYPHSEDSLRRVQ